MRHPHSNFPRITWLHLWPPPGNLASSSVSARTQTVTVIEVFSYLDVSSSETDCPLCLSSILSWLKWSVRRACCSYWSFRLFRRATSYQTFATYLAFGEDPVKISYQQCAMREHFAKCLKGEKMEQFPRSKCSAHTSIRRVASILYMPDAWLPGQYGGMWNMLWVVLLSLHNDTVSWSYQEYKGRGKRWLNWQINSTMYIIVTCFVY